MKKVIISQEVKNVIFRLIEESPHLKGGFYLVVKTATILEAYNTGGAVQVWAYSGLGKPIFPQPNGVLKKTVTPRLSAGSRTFTTKINNRGEALFKVSPILKNDSDISRLGTAKNTVMS